MGLYECIHDCGIDEEGNNCYCVSIQSTLDPTSDETCWQIRCSKHRDIKIGSKFQYCFSKFYYQFKKRESPILEYDFILTENMSSKEIHKENERCYSEELLVRDVEVVDMKDVEYRKGTIKVLRLRVNLDCSLLNDSKKINFSMFDDDVTSWCKEKVTTIDEEEDNYHIVTLQFFEDSIYKPCYRGNNICYNWKTNSICTLEEYKREKDFESEVSSPLPVEEILCDAVEYELD